jgi:hypothetical protein
VPGDPPYWKEEGQDEDNGGIKNKTKSVIAIVTQDNLNTPEPPPEKNEDGKSEAQNTETPPTVVPEARLSHLWIYIGIGVLLCLGGVFFFMRKK